MLFSHNRANFTFDTFDTYVAMIGDRRIDVTRWTPGHIGNVVLHAAFFEAEDRSMLYLTRSMSEEPIAVTRTWKGGTRIQYAQSVLGQGDGLDDFVHLNGELQRQAHEDFSGAIGGLVNAYGAITLHVPKALLLNPPEGGVQT